MNLFNNILIVFVLISISLESISSQKGDGRSNSRGGTSGSNGRSNSRGGVSSGTNSGTGSRGTADSSSNSGPAESGASSNSLRQSNPALTNRHLNRNHGSRLNGASGGDSGSLAPVASPDSAPSNAPDASSSGPSAPSNAWANRDATLAKIKPNAPRGSDSSVGIAADSGSVPSDSIPASAPSDDNKPQKKPPVRRPTNNAHGSGSAALQADSGTGPSDAGSIPASAPSDDGPASGFPNDKKPQKKPPVKRPNQGAHGSAPSGGADTDPGVPPSAPANAWADRGTTLNALTRHSGSAQGAPARPASSGSDGPIKSDTHYYHYTSNEVADQIESSGTLFGSKGRDGSKGSHGVFLTKLTPENSVDGILKNNYGKNPGAHFQDKCQTAFCFDKSDIPKVRAVPGHKKADVHFVPGLKGLDLSKVPFSRVPGPESK